MAATIRGTRSTPSIPVMGHVGLTPQSVRRLGGYKVQRDAEADRRRRRRPWPRPGPSPSCSNACRPTSPRGSPRALPIPTIGIGAGPHCDGQVLVTPDLLGLFDDFRPKFVRRYAELGTLIQKAAAAYVADVASGKFPNDQESFH